MRPGPKGITTSRAAVLTRTSAGATLNAGLSAASPPAPQGEKRRVRSSIMEPPSPAFGGYSPRSAGGEETGQELNHGAPLPRLRRVLPPLRRGRRRRSGGHIIGPR